MALADGFRSPANMRTMLLFLIMWSSVFGQMTAGQEGSSIAKAGIEISVSDGEVFYVPILDKHQMLALIPVANNPYAAIQISGDMQSDAVDIDVVALLATAGRSFPIKDCSELKGWKNHFVGKYSAKPHTTVVLSDLKALGLPSVTVKVTPPRPAINASSGTSFCSCGRSLALPRLGKCLEPGGNCGFCCYSPSP
jgi:hypothetical protein